MHIQFVCKGNASRSLLAETYLRSLQIPELTVSSSGTVAAANKKANHKYYLLTKKLLKDYNLLAFIKKNYGEQLNQQQADSADLLVFMNENVYKDATQIISVPQHNIVWSVTDTGEAGREYNIPEERSKLLEEMFSEIKENVIKLAKELNLT